MQIPHANKFSPPKNRKRKANSSHTGKMQHANRSSQERFLGQGYQDNQLNYRRYRNVQRMPDENNNTKISTGLKAFFRWIHKHLMT